MRESQDLLAVLERQKCWGKLYAATGAAPALVFADSGLAPPISTCFPSTSHRERLDGPSDDDVVIYNNVVTSQGGGSAFWFAIELGELLCEDKAKADLVARKRLVDRSGKIGFQRTLVQDHKSRVPCSPQDEESDRGSSVVDGVIGVGMCVLNHHRSHPPQFAEASTFFQTKGTGPQRMTGTDLCRQKKCNRSTLRQARHCNARFVYKTSEELNVSPTSRVAGYSPSRGSKRKKRRFDEVALDNIGSGSLVFDVEIPLIGDGALVASKTIRADGTSEKYFSQYLTPGPDNICKRKGGILKARCCSSLVENVEIASNPQRESGGLASKDNESHVDVLRAESDFTSPVCQPRNSCPSLVEDVQNIIKASQKNDFLSPSLKENGKQVHVDLAEFDSTSKSKELSQQTRKSGPRLVENVAISTTALHQRDAPFPQEHGRGAGIDPAELVSTSNLEKPIQKTRKSSPSFEIAAKVLQHSKASSPEKNGKQRESSTAKRTRFLYFRDKRVQSTIWKTLSKLGWTTKALPKLRQRHYYPPMEGELATKRKFDSLTKAIKFLRTDHVCKTRSDIRMALSSFEKMLPRKEEAKSKKDLSSKAGKPRRLEKSNVPCSSLGTEDCIPAVESEPTSAINRRTRRSSPTAQVELRDILQNRKLLSRNKRKRNASYLRAVDDMNPTVGGAARGVSADPIDGSTSSNMKSSTRKERHSSVSSSSIESMQRAALGRVTRNSSQPLEVPAILANEGQSKAMPADLADGSASPATRNSPRKSKNSSSGSPSVKFMNRAILGPSLSNSSKPLRVPDGGADTSTRVKTRTARTRLNDHSLSEMDDEKSAKDSAQDETPGRMTTRSSASALASFKTPSKKIVSPCKFPTKLVTSFFTHVWARLKEFGWALGPDQHFYLPGVIPGSGRRREDYFDSSKQVIAYLKRNENWSNAPEIREALRIYDSQEPPPESNESGAARCPTVRRVTQCRKLLYPRLYSRRGSPGRAKKDWRYESEASCFII
jgi:hypothetical protein